MNEIKREREAKQKPYKNSEFVEFLSF